MNANQIINMVIRMIVRRVIGKGVNAGINAVGRRAGRNQDHAPRQGGQGGNASAETTRRAKQAMRVTRRVGRM